MQHYTISLQLSVCYDGSLETNRFPCFLFFLIHLILFLHLVIRVRPSFRFKRTRKEVNRMTFSTELSQLQLEQMSLAQILPQ